jgi:tetratricopeptide (TPR) repeat protein
MRMPTHTAFTAAEPSADTIVRACLKSLDEIEQRPDVLESAVRSNISPGELRNLTAEDYAFLYATAQSLVAAKDFRRALAVALAIVTHQGREAKYSYLAGTCLHQLALLEQAATMYNLALQQDPSNAMAAYRLGQCLSRVAPLRPADLSNTLLS